MVQVAENSHEENTAILSNTSQDEAQGSKSIIEDAYKVISRGMMADQIKTTSPQVNLELMETALKNRNVPLAKNHMEELNKQLNKDIILDIMIRVSKWLYRTENEPVNFEPSAPPLVENDDERNDNWMVEPLSRLRDNCLQILDRNGDFVLKKKEIENLHYNDLHEIAFRDTLVISSEFVVYSAIMRWCSKQCETKCKDRDSANIKSILKDLVYATRYGLMSEKDFLSRTIDGHKGPDRIGILNEKETNEILKYIKQREKKKKSLNELPYKMSRHRCVLEKSNRRSGNMDTCIVNFLTCWTTLFD